MLQSGGEAHHLYNSRTEISEYLLALQTLHQKKSPASYAAKGDWSIMPLDASLLDAMPSPQNPIPPKCRNLTMQIVVSHSLRAPHLFEPACSCSPFPWDTTAFSYLPPPLMTTRAPSFPNTPCSTGFGLLSLPLFRDKKPNIPVGFPRVVPMPSSPVFSGGIAALGFVRSDHEPVSPSTTCNPPPLDVLRVTKYDRVKHIHGWINHTI